MPSQIDSVAVRAVATLRGPDNTSVIQGSIYFSQTIGMDQIRMSGEIRGLPTDRKLILHVHEYGDLSNGPNSTGGRFTPDKKVSTSSSKDPLLTTGDSGYLQVSAEGVAKVDYVDKRLTLFGPSSIIGRALVVMDEKEDDAARAEPEENKGTVTIASNRLAAGVIGICQ